MYLAPRRMTDRDGELDRKPHHLVLLAENQAGYHNLLQIASAAQLQGFYYHPRVDKDFLQGHCEGLIALSGCGSGEIPRLLMNGRWDDARRTAQWYRDLFGPKGFFIELQDHDIPELRAIQPKLIELARELQIPMVLTNDVHYVRQDDARAHDILLCIQTNSTITEPNRMRMSDNGYFLKNAEEMTALFPDLPEAMRNTLSIAERCDVDLDSNGYHLPPFPVPDRYDARSYLQALCEEGLKARYPEISPAIRRRLEYELEVIHTMGFDTYFLIVWDLCMASKQRDIWWNVRGSGAASIVAYALGITNLDPLRNGLIFERFLNPDRVSMPDIDLDYPDDRRAEMIQYTIEKYGQEQVAQIITFGTLGARAAIRDVGRAMDIPLPEVDRIAKLVPGGPKVTIDQALEEVEELRLEYHQADDIRQLLDTARSIEGVARHASTHAAGVIISDRPLVHYTPLHRSTNDSGDAGSATTQFPMEILESIGLLKVDFLGLSTLTLMRRACEYINQFHGVELNLDTIPIEDQKAFELLASGNVTGVFQVESPGMRRVLTTMRPSQFEHIVATVALYRPGPMEYIDTYIRRLHGEEPVEYKHPLLEPILSETYGIIVYQEQIIRILTDLAGYSAGEADLLRRAVGKKKKEELVRHRDLFVSGCREHSGLSEEVADAIYSDILFFARYGFNKAHAADYAVITCQTAYLKAHYPVEYMAALLTVEQNNTEKIGQMVAECRKMGIEVLPPDINRSRHTFTIENRDSIRFGLAAIKNVGAGQVDLILAERDAGGEFSDIDDFCRRVDLRQINKRVLECMIKAGVFDCFGERGLLLAVCDRMVAESASSHHAQEIGQMSMFDLDAGLGSCEMSSILHPLPKVAEIDRRQLLLWERELAGVYLSSHPLQKLAEDLKDRPITWSGEINEELAGHMIEFAGMVTGVREITTKTSKLMAFVQMEDLHGTVELVVFPKTYQHTRDLWVLDRILWVRAKVEVRDQRVTLLCQTVQDNIQTAQIDDTDTADTNQSTGYSNKGDTYLPAGDRERPAAPQSHCPQMLHITLHRSSDHGADLQRLKKICQTLRSYEGQDHYIIHVVDEKQRVQLDFPNMNTGYCQELESRLRNLIGSGSLRVDNQYYV